MGEWSKISVRTFGVVKCYWSLGDITGVMELLNVVVGPIHILALCYFLSKVAIDTLMDSVKLGYLLIRFVWMRCDDEVFMSCGEDRELVESSIKRLVYALKGRRMAVCRTKS